MADGLTHLAEDCGHCRSELGMGYRRGQLIADMYGNGIGEVGNCAKCRTQRLARIQDWEHLKSQTTDRLMRLVFASAQTALGVRSAQWCSARWWLSRRSAVLGSVPTVAVDVAQRSL